MSTAGSLVLVATSNKHILLYDTRNLSQPLQVRNSPLRNQIRQVTLSPLACDFFVVASTEARVAVEHVNQDPAAQKMNYAFRCHRKDNVAYPVNAVDFHPVNGTFATGGCDGVVNIYDAAARKKVCELGSYNNSIASLAFSSDGSRIAVASSYTYEKGCDDPAGREDNIFIRKVPN